MINQFQIEQLVLEKNTFDVFILSVSMTMIHLNNFERN